MDRQGQTGVAGEKHNGTGVVDPVICHRAVAGDPVSASAQDAPQPADNGTQWRPPAPPAPPAETPAGTRARATARVAGPSPGGAHRAPGGDTEDPFVPGLNDATPPGGTPAMEPPLWREATRRVAPTSPAWGGSPAEGRSRYQQDTASELDTTSELMLPTVASPAPADPPDPDPAMWQQSDWQQPAWEPPAPISPAPTSAPPVSAPPVSGVPVSPAPVWAPPVSGVPVSPAPVWASRAVPPEPVEPVLEELPQRVPAEPDVPDLGVPDRDAVPAAAPELLRIADQLRRDDIPAGQELVDTFDVDEVLDAVREVSGVRAATLRANPEGAHTLRLDLSDSADPVQVSRVVARLLQERMGLSAAPRHVPHPRTPEPDTRRPETRPGWVSHSPAATPPASALPPAEVPPRAGSPPLAEEQLPPAGDPPPADDPPLAEASAAATGMATFPIAPTGNRVLIDQVQVNVDGLEATVEVRLTAGSHRALGLASGPAIESYMVRLAAVSAAKAVDEFMQDDELALATAPVSRCFVEHTGVVPFGATEVAVVVVLLVCGGWVEQLAGSAIVDGDARHAAVRATLGAVNRRLDALLAN